MSDTSAPSGRQFFRVDDWRAVIQGRPNDAAVGRVRVGDLRMLLHRIDELEAELARHRTGAAHSFAGPLDYVAEIPKPPAGAT